MADEPEHSEIGYPPSPGSYHIYHRIDGELIAIGVCEFTNKYFNSAYFMYKTKYSYLNLGVVGAVIELEICRKLREMWSPDLSYYHLGELVLDCPKVNYKLNYQPGQVLCPYSKLWVDFEIAKPQILHFMNLTKKQKSEIVGPLKLNPDTCDLFTHDDFIPDNLYFDTI